MCKSVCLHSAARARVCLCFHCALPRRHRRCFSFGFDSIPLRVHADAPSSTDLAHITIQTEYKLNNKFYLKSSNFILIIYYSELCKFQCCVLRNDEQNFSEHSKRQKSD